MAKDGLLWAAWWLTLWGRHFVEPVIAPPDPQHIIAQQFLAICLQEGRVGSSTWREWWPGLSSFQSAEPVLSHLVSNGFLDSDDGMLFIGPSVEKAFGHRHIMEVTSVFTSPPEFTVLHGARR